MIPVTHGPSIIGHRRWLCYLTSDSPKPNVIFSVVPHGPERVFSNSPIQYIFPSLCPGSPSIRATYCNLAVGSMMIAKVVVDLVVVDCVGVLEGL